ncbi:MAG TPA: cupin-like domain-containing protein [Saprospiraceae bacterium]|nr:cupin-like domain-containing protein [Saprospiraceae bacterium]HQW56277.1 cupin-like domain-containing protein [Saprospiraceae bacterium]
MQLKEIERRSGLTKEIFKKEYLDPNIPVVITDLAKEWPGLDKWSWEFFKNEYGDLKVPMVDKTFHKPGPGYMVKHIIPFREYIESIEHGPSDMRLFLFNIFQAAPELRDDFKFPEIMDGFVKSLPFMFFGGQGSITPLHYDIDCPSNFLTHFVTRKRIVLFDQAQSKYLYHHPFTVQSHMDINNPDYEQYPALRKAVGYEAIIGHGETIYIPPHWWHYIEYVDSGFSLALRAHNKLSNKFVAVKNLVQHSLIDKGMNNILGTKWQNWKRRVAFERAERD